MRVLITTLIWAVPPYIRRVRRRARLKSRLVIPDTFIRFPAKIKNGTAKKAKDWLWDGSLIIEIFHRTKKREAGDTDNKSNRHPHNKENHKTNKQERH